MTARKLAFALLLLTAAACHRAPAPDLAEPGAYALQVPLKPGAGGSLQRVTLPVAVLAAIKRSDLGDVRVFDGRGRLVPLALLAQAPDNVQHRTSVPVYPVVGPARARGAGLSIRVEGTGAARVVTVDSGAPSGAGAAPPIAVLLDTRALREPANALTFAADIPAGLPVTLTLLTSANLMDWQPLVEQVLFRPAAGPALPGGFRVSLPGADLRGRYIGISWGDAASVTLTGAAVITSALAPPARIAVATSAVPLASAHEVRFDLPDLARLAAIRVTPAGADGVIPVKLYGRTHREDPWSLLAAATLRSGVGAGAGATAIDLPGPPMSGYRLEADRRTAGFSAAPQLELLFDPAELLVALSGNPPYRLVAGQAAAPPGYLTLAEIAPLGVPLNLAALPRAVPAPAGPPPVIALPAGSDGALEPRKLALWAALLLGTLVLAFAAFRLLRGTAAVPTR